MDTNKKTKEDKYIEGIGRRKTAIARVRISKNSKPTFVINGKKLSDYFHLKEHQHIALESLKKASLNNSMSVSVKVLGGGIAAQADAIRHGIARAVIDLNSDLRPELKHAGFLKRDPRAKERKKFGLKKARKAPQWSKR
ncbi:MAG: 30S ribosomal protein S9 [Patescibacteria group bacterium]